MFLIGMPRSGTKLLREMLNLHPRIAFSDVETDFFPYWVSNWDQLMPSPDAAAFDRFYAACLGLPFFIQVAQRGIHVDRAAWRAACESMKPADVFDGLMRHCLGIPRSGAGIWGDKSPSYIRHVPLLMRQFPDARVVHIVRDVRDYVLSIHDAWRKSELRAAQRWQDDVSKARVDGARFTGRYFEVRYEDLITGPEEVLTKLCAQMDIEFDRGMLSPARAFENLGAAKNTIGLAGGNAGKYKYRLRPELAARIERIACTTLRQLGYPCAYKGPPVRVPGWRLRMLQAMDGLNLIIASAGRFGVLKAVKFHLRAFMTSGNRK